MKMILRVLLAFCLSRAVLAASTPTVDLVSLSPQVFPATAREQLTGLDWNLSVSRFGDVVNNEMAWAPADIPYSHIGYFIFVDPTTFEPEPMQFVLDIPPFADVNHNGIFDFFDPAVGI